MSNLIISIISIVLVGIAAIMAVFYVGPAFENGQAKAYANTIAQQAMQINNAITQWQLDNNAGFLTTLHQRIQTSCGGANFSTVECLSNNNPIAAILTPNWLQSMTPPDTADFAGKSILGGTLPSYWELSGSDNDEFLEATLATNGYFIYLYAVKPVTSTAVAVCNQIAIMARGPNAVPVQNSSFAGAAFNSAAPYIAGENPVLDCYWNPSTASGFTQLNSCIGDTSNCNLFIAAQVGTATF